MSLLVPSLSQPSLTNACSSSSSNAAAATEISVTRSISDVIKITGGQGQQPCDQNKQQQQLPGRKTKEERRLSNRQKLMSLKRHSGYLKRPEILETVYSVEEDADGQLAHYQNQQGQEKEAVAEENEQQNAQPSGSGPGSSEKPSSTESPPPPTGTGAAGTPSAVRSPAALALTGSFRYRLDSDMTTSDNDYSTDDDSTRIFYSETSPDCSCFSQPGSRRSSYGTGGGGYSLPCSRRSSSGHTPSSLGQYEACHCGGGGNSGNGGGSGSGSCAACGGNGGACQCSNSSRRSSLGGSMSHVSTSDENNESLSNNDNVSKTYNRVMNNHRAVTKPKDVKFKRISKAKSRSLEELRGKLRWQHPCLTGGQQQVAAGGPSPAAAPRTTPATSLPVNPDLARVTGSTSMSATRRRGLFRRMGPSLSLDHQKQSEA